MTAALCYLMPALAFALIGVAIAALLRQRVAVTEVDSFDNVVPPDARLARC